MKPVTTKLLIMVGAVAMWSSAAYADDHHGWSGNGHDAERHHDGGYHQDDRSLHNAGRYSDHDGRYARNGYDGYQQPQQYHGRDRYYPQHRYGFYPAHPGYYSSSPQRHHGTTFGVFLGRGGYGHHSGHGRHY